MINTSNLQRPVGADVDPEDDPNNQGEDEFEEAEQQRHAHEIEEEEEPAPVGNPKMHLAVKNQHQPPAEEQLVVSNRFFAAERSLLTSRRDLFSAWCLIGVWNEIVDQWVFSVGGDILYFLYKNKKQTHSDLVWEAECCRGYLYYATENVWSFVCFVQMAGNPDQQEDALDEQYQEDGDDEVG